MSCKEDQNQPQGRLESGEFRPSGQVAWESLTRFLKQKHTGRSRGYLRVCAWSATEESVTYRGQRDLI